MGTIFHKLISSAIMCNLKEKLPWHILSVQFGVGMPGGAENIVHGIRNLLSDHPDWVLVSLDLTNALNSVSRVAFFKQVQDKFPSSSHGCCSVMDNSTHTYLSEVLNQSLSL